MAWSLLASICASCSERTKDSVSAPPGSGLRGSKICKPCAERIRGEIAQREVEEAENLKRIADEARARRGNQSVEVVAAPQEGSRRSDSARRMGLYRLTILLPLLKMRRLLRRFLGPTTPPWLGDASDLLGNLNLTATLPSFLAIFVVPRHFFRRIGSDGHPGMFLALSPVKLILQTAALIPLILIAMQKILPGFEVRDATSQNIVIGLAITTIASLFLIPLSIALMGALVKGSDSYHGPMPLVFSLPIAIAVLIFPLEISQTCVRNVVHKRIVFPKYLWGTSYITMTALVSAPILVLVEAAVIDGIVSLDGSGRWLWGVAEFTCFLIGVAAFSMYVRLLIEAYAAMLDAACS